MSPDEGMSDSDLARIKGAANAALLREPRLRPLIDLAACIAEIERLRSTTAQAVQVAAGGAPPLSPEGIDAVLDGLTKAHAMVTALCKPRGTEGARDWMMSIPARPDYDPDLVIGSALRAARVAILALRDASVSGGQPSAASAASAPEGYTLEMAYREGWFDSKDGDGQSCADAWSQSYAKAASESYLPYLARPPQADQGASGKSVPPPTTSGSPS